MRILLTQFANSNLEPSQDPFRMVIYQAPDEKGVEHVYNDETLTNEVVIPDNAEIKYATFGLLYGIEMMPNVPQQVQAPMPMPEGDKDKKPSAYDFAQYIVSKEHLKKCKGIIYLYYGGCYHPIDSDRLNYIIMTLCRDQMLEKGNSYFARQVADAIASLPDIYCEQLPCYQNLIPFPNGLLDISTMQFFPPDPNIFVRYAVSVPFDKYQWHCPVFCQFLNTVTSGNPLLQQRLLEIIGYLLSAHNDAKKFFVFVGVSNSGKSVLIRLIQSLLNEESVYSADMNALGDRFTTGYMNGSQLCVFADMPSTSISNEAVGIIKAVTGGDTVIGERKYQAPEKIMNTTRLLFSTNHEIKTSSRDDAFFNRCCIVPFMVSIPPEFQNPILFNMLLEERQAIVNMAIYSYCQMRWAQGGMAVEFTGEEVAKALYRQYCRSNFSAKGDLNSIYSEFVSQCCVPSEGSITPTKTLYDAFSAFCQQRNYYIPEYMSFSRQIPPYLEQYDNKRTRIDGDNVRCYHGISLLV